MIPLWAALAVGSGLLGMNKAQQERAMEDSRRNLAASEQQYTGYTGSPIRGYTPGAKPNDLQGFLGGAIQPAIYGSGAGGVWGEDIGDLWAKLFSKDQAGKELIKAGATQ